MQTPPPCKEQSTNNRVRPGWNSNSLQLKSDLRSWCSSAYQVSQWGSFKSGHQYQTLCKIMPQGAVQIFRAHRLHCQSRMLRKRDSRPLRPQQGVYFPSLLQGQLLQDRRGFLRKRSQSHRPGSEEVASHWQRNLSYWLRPLIATASNFKTAYQSFPFMTTRPICSWRTWFPT
jgi:hypothetical protein